MTARRIPNVPRRLGRDTGDRQGIEVADETEREGRSQSVRRSIVSPETEWGSNPPRPEATPDDRIGPGLPERDPIGKFVAAGARRTCVNRYRGTTI